MVDPRPPGTSSPDAGRATPGSSRRTLLRGAALLPLAASLPGCSLATDLVNPGPGVKVAVSWSADELAAFRRVLGRLDSLPGFKKRNYRVDLVPLGDDISYALTGRGAGRLDLVMLPRPGLVGESLDSLQPLSPGLWQEEGGQPRYSAGWRSLLFHRNPRTGETLPYGLPFKLAHKSLVWYRTDLFKRHRLSPPETWQDWLGINAKLIESGVAPLALGGADGWMLTGFFENVLLGHSPSAYDQLSAASAPRPWDTADVRAAFQLLGQMWAPSRALAGGVRKSLVQQFPDAVLEVFRYHRAAMVVAPDFAEPIVDRFDLSRRRASDDVGIFAFPALDCGQPLVAGGDVMVLTRPASEQAKDLLARLANPSAPLEWMRAGGFIAADLRASQDGYSKEIEPFARQVHTMPFHFDLADQLGAVGSSEGLFRVLQDFLAEVGDGHAERIEAATDRAIKALLAVEDAQSGDNAREVERRDLVRSQRARGINGCDGGSPDGS
ncbi:ABC transporter substrate-binding protein [Actinopolymorpha alba]|uniref:ABC transporter substrate-binding protein n=1 Tax=Actinopolymorpha alba TaxID=533267 RepID=UPI00192B660F|nr:ABC transporter substrate-binding protein [Actinopolymorpha alba]